MDSSKLTQQSADSFSPSLNACQGCLLGTAIGDALGLSLEGLSAQYIKQHKPDLQHYHFLFHKGMLSDDSEHTCLVAQALIHSRGQPKDFEQDLARRLRYWLLLLPAGVGWATLRAVSKLWLGLPPAHSGVFSAGNAPAMRSALLGVCYGHDMSQLRALVKAATHLTHTDPKAEYGALTVAIAAYLASTRPTVEPEVLLAQLHVGLYGGGQVESHIDADSQMCLKLVAQVAASVEEGQSTAEFAIELGLHNGVTGYVYHTVPIALHAWLSYPHAYLQAVQTAIFCGGDTDTVAAITGAIVGAGVGEQQLPKHLLDDLWEYPRSVNWMRRLAVQLQRSCVETKPQSVLTLFWGNVLLRNIIFLLIVLVHGFKRIFFALFAQFKRL